MSKFSCILSGLRREKGFSQREAAADLGISQALLSHYENSAREPKLEFVVRVCDYYDVSVDYILGRDCEKKPRVIPAPQGCENSPRFLTAMDEVFEILVDLDDPELFADAVDCLSVPAENIAILLRDPFAAYDPSRDVRQKLAEAKLVERAKVISHESDIPEEACK